MPSNELKSLGRIAGALLIALSLGASVTPSFAVDSGGGSSDSSSSSSEPSGPTLSDARGLIRAGKWKSAVTMLKKIVASNPGSADANNLLGYSLRKSGDYKNAEGFYLKALKINPRHKGANEYLGELYVEIGQLTKAKKQLEKLQQICGNTSCEEYEDLEKFIAAAG